MNYLRKVFLFSILTFCLNAFAGGDSVGNGGVLWVCRSGPGDQSLHAGILSDLFEAKEQFAWPLIQTSLQDPFKIYEQRKQWVANDLPELFTSLRPRFEYVEQHLSFVNADLTSTKDFNNAIKPLPSTCPQGQWKAQNIANFREEDQQILIANELWQSPLVGALDKAALLMHEAVYYWMRTYFGSTDSDKSRKLTGLLFSSLPTNTIKTEIAKILGRYSDYPEGKFICVMKNSKRNQIFVGYSQSVNEASLTVRQRCQADPDPKWCERSSIVCEEIVSEPQRQCHSENLASRIIYRGQGRNKLEAQFNSHMGCYYGSLAQNVSPQQCPDLVFIECF